jgi:LysM repeat protein
MRTTLMRSSLVIAALALTVPVFAQSGGLAELGSLRQDLMMLNQRVGELSMAVERLDRENEALKSAARQNYATVDQLNRSLADANRSVHAAMDDQRRDILAQVAAQLEKLGKQTNAALDSMAKGQAARPVVQSTFSDDFPKEGVNYTVQAGDTLAVIARTNNAKLQDIINANKISDPTKIKVGQTLFIPQGK